MLFFEFEVYNNEIKYGPLPSQILFGFPEASLKYTFSME